MNLTKGNIFSEWILWQFYEVPIFLLEVWKNYLSFAANIFSVKTLLKTLFSPWRKYNWRYPKGFDIVEFFNTLISNIFSRILGFLMRIVLIITGLLLWVLVFLTGMAVIVCWVLTPLAVILGIFIFLLF